MKDQKAFTLIELLVVISIIALLSSVVLASLNTAREKGRLAAARQFAAQAEHVAGEQAVGIWDFDECSGSTANDRSGFGLNGTLVAAATSSWSTDTPSGAGCSVVFNGSTQYVSIPASPNLDMGGSSFTVSLWLKKAVGSGTGMVFEHSIWGATDTYQIEHTSAGAIRMNFPAMNGAPGPLDASVVVLDGKWHNIVETLDAQAQTAKLYYDGALVGSSAVSVTPSVGTGLTFIGCRGNVTLCMAGSVDAVRVYKKALTASEVQASYALESGKGVAARQDNKI